MKTHKKEILYLGLLIVNIIIIYSTFKQGFSKVFMSQEYKDSIFFLSLNSYLYMFASMILLSLTLYLYLNMSTYKVGKIFTIYIAVVAFGICMMTVTNYVYEGINILIGVLALISNAILLYLVGCLTLISKKRYFRQTIVGIAIMLIFGIIFMLYYKYKLTNVFLKLITIDYVATILVLLVNMLIGYRNSSRYTKKHIKFLASGLMSGIIIFFIMHSLPTIALISFSDEKVSTNTKRYSQIQLENMQVQHAIYPIMIFIGIVIVLIYVLMKREYLPMDSISEFRFYLISNLYLVIANTCFQFILQNDMSYMILINSILIFPLLLYNHNVSGKDSSIYTCRLIDELEKERQKLSIYLHDEILQDLITVYHTNSSEESSKELLRLISDVRNVSQNLYPTIAEDLGLEEAVKVFIGEINCDYNVEVEFDYEYPNGALPKGIALLMYRMIKELVMNAIKHSEGLKIKVMILEAQGGINTIVTDDGKGFQIQEEDKNIKNQHMGLYTIRKQIKDLNGNMRMISNSEGSEIHIFIPLR